MSLPTTFADALKTLYGEEGGYTVDAGGPTRWGITEAVARAHGYAGDMRDYPIESATAIYRPAYWDAVRADDLPALLRFAVFDCAVNSGVGEATRILQACAGVTVDGELGAMTLAAVGLKPPESLLRAFCGRRLELMAGLPNFDVDGRGWIRRVAAILVA